MTFWIFIRTQRIAEQYIIIRSDQTRPFETRPTEICWLTRYSHITEINLWILLAFVRRINERLSCVSFHINLKFFGGNHSIQFLLIDIQLLGIRKKQRYAFQLEDVIALLARTNENISWMYKVRPQQRNWIHISYC